MTMQCPKCGDGKITTVWPKQTETRFDSEKKGRLRLECFHGQHEFEVALPSHPEQKLRLLNEAFPCN